MDQVAHPIERQDAGTGAFIENRREIVFGPLFKDLYAEAIDFGSSPASSSSYHERRSLLAHSTDIQDLNQFKMIHHVPEKWGTPFHHGIYCSAMR